MHYAHALEGYLKRKCPRLPAATITALTAATCGVLTGFVSFRPADLGHNGKLTGGADAGQRDDPSSYASSRTAPISWAERVASFSDGGDMRPQPNELGAWGEAVAARLLQTAGWTVVEHGFRLGRREIDLIATRKGTVAFVEVKTRSGSGFGTPEEAVTWRKRREIEVVATAYLTSRDHAYTDVRFDVVSIVTDARKRIVRCEHIEDAWRPEPRNR